MAWSNVLTLLPLDTYFDIIGIDRWTANQISLGFPDNSKIGMNAGCKAPFYQYEWQANALSRTEIAEAIARAEDLLAEALQFYPAPKYVAQEQLQYPHRQMPYAYGLGAWAVVPFSSYPQGYSASVQVKYHKVWGGGVLARTLIGDTANLTITDSDSDGVDDTFTASIATTITDPYEIGVYFLAADRVPTSDPISETWRLRPVTVTITGGIATIVGHSTLLVLPNLETIVNAEPLDVTDTAIYAAQVTVYRVYRDTTQSGNAYWELQTDCTQTPCTLETETVCVGDRNGRMGQVFIGFDNENCCTQWRAPDKVTLNYLAGEAEINGQMNPIYAQYVAYLATALLEQDSCGCDRSTKIIQRLRYDVVEGIGNTPGRPLTAWEEQSAFGYRRGALTVWNAIRGKNQITGAVV